MQFTWQWQKMATAMGGTTITATEGKEYNNQFHTAILRGFAHCRQLAGLPPSTYLGIIQPNKIN
jgi:hypothetical protein